MVEIGIEIDEDTLEEIAEELGKMVEDETAEVSLEISELESKADVSLLAEET